MVNVVKEALDEAAGADDPALTQFDLTHAAIPSKRRIAGAREVVKRFLEQLPGEMTVADVRELLDD